MDPRDEAAQDFNRIAPELERAAEHARTAANHFRERDIPSSGAHTVALFGHLEHAKELLANHTKIAAHFACVPGSDPEQA